MALDKFRDPADPIWEQRVNQLEEGTGVGEITSAKLPTEGVVGSKIEPKVLGKRLLWASTGVLTAAEATGTYYFLKTGAVLGKGSPTVFEYTTAPDLFRAVKAQWAIVGRTPVLTLVVNAYVNAKAPGSTFTAGMYKLEKSEGATGKNAIKYTAVTAASKAAITAPAAETEVEAKAENFAWPADGTYSLGVEVSVEALKAESQVLFTASLYVAYT